MVGAGAEYLYGLIVQLLGRERPFALEDPCYAQIRRIYEANGASCTPLPMGEDGIQSAALAGCGAGVLHVTPYHSYPSGVTASAAKRHEYDAWVRERGSLIVEDDYESEFSLLRKVVETVFAAAPMQNVIYMNTFSRTVSPSLRVGYMVLPRRLVSVFHLKVGFYSCSVPAFEQYVLAELLDSGDFERHVNRIRRRERKQG